MIRTSIALLTLTLVFAACKSTGVDRAQKSANAMKAQHKALADAPAKIDAVVTTLNGLAAPGADMTKQWGLFNSAVTALQAHRSRIQGLSKQVQSNREGFAAEWQKRLDAISDQDLRARAVERRDAVVQKFEHMGETAEAGSVAFESWLETVTNLQAYLENDLNPGGVASVADKIKEVNDGAPPINDTIQTIVDELDALAASIAAGKPPAPAEGGSDTSDSGS